MASALEDRMLKHPFFEDFVGDTEKIVSKIVSFTGEAEYHDGELLIEESGEADSFFLLEDGVVSVELEGGDGKTMEIQSLFAPGTLGWSWLIPPHRWKFDARANGSVEAIRIDGRQLRNLCQDNPALGNRFHKRMAMILSKRLTGTRMSLLAETHPDFEPNYSY